MTLSGNEQGQVGGGGLSQTQRAKYNAVPCPSLKGMFKLPANNAFEEVIDRLFRNVGK